MSGGLSGYVVVVPSKSREFVHEYLPKAMYIDWTGEIPKIALPMGATRCVTRLPAIVCTCGQYLIEMEAA